MELREITIWVRFGLWGYLVAATEKPIAANGFSDENQLEVYPLVLLIVPFGVVWSISYRNLTKFRGFRNSNWVHKIIMYSAGSLLPMRVVFFGNIVYSWESLWCRGIIIHRGIHSLLALQHALRVPGPHRLDPKNWRIFTRRFAVRREPRFFL